MGIQNKQERLQRNGELFEILEWLERNGALIDEPDSEAFREAMIAAGGTVIGTPDIEPPEAVSVLAAAPTDSVIPVSSQAGTDRQVSTHVANRQVTERETLGEPSVDATPPRVVQRVQSSLTRLELWLERLPLPSFSNQKLFEYIVIFAIFMTCVGLFIPWLRENQQTAKRIYCINNLKQIGLSMANYESAFGSYPWGEGPSADNYWGPLALAVPYMELGSAFDTINFVFGSANSNGTRIPYPSGDRVQVNATAFSQRLNIALCPADSRDGLSTAAGHTNYAGSGGTTSIGYAVDFDGIFGKVDGTNDPYLRQFIHSPRGKIITLNDILDGTANTALFSERVKGLGAADNDIVDSQNPSTSYWVIPNEVALNNTYGLGTGFTSWSQAAQITYTNCSMSRTRFKPSNATASYTPQTAMGTYWWMGQWNAGRYNHVMPPNSMFCTTGGINEGEVAFGTSSYHPGGVNVLFADGSVHFIKSTIAPQTWWSLGTRAGGEILGVGQY